MRYRASGEGHDSSKPTTDVSTRGGTSRAVALGARARSVAESSSSSPFSSLSDVSSAASLRRDGGADGTVLVEGDWTFIREEVKKADEKVVGPNNLTRGELRHRYNI